MRYFLLFFLTIYASTFTLGQQTLQQNEAQLAASFYNAKQYDKAAELYLKLYNKTNQAYYFDNYVNSLVYLEQYDDAIKALKKEVRKTHNTNLEITLGYVYNQMGDIEKAKATYDDIIKNMPKSKAVVISIGNAFLNRRELEYSEKAYLHGREILPGEMFYNNLANIYAYQRDYPKMMNEFMALLKENERNIVLVESRLNSLLRVDFDGSLRTTIKKEVIKSIQAEPGVIAYNRLFIWFQISEKNYDQALKNTIALDRRTKTEEDNIVNFARSAANLGQYDVALDGLNYLLNRKQIPSNINLVRQEKVRTEYQRYINTPPKQRMNSAQLKAQFEQLLNTLGYNAETTDLINYYAHFLAFYLNDPSEAMTVLETGLKARGLNNYQRSILQIEQADINVFNHKLWDATLQYAQIIDRNKENAIGDEVKLKKAKLSFYLGDIVWARGQLDALKASTSKLIANDAMELSLLISANYDLDSIDEPIQMFARGDLYLFQNKDSLAEVTYDSILVKYPNHSLSDKIMMREAKIAEVRFEFDTAAVIYEKVVKNYSYSTSADDALYRLAILEETKLDNPDKAQDLFKQLLVDFPGSIFVADARNRYRMLRGDFPVKEEPTPYDDSDVFNNL